MEKLISPVQFNERIKSLDILRGIAILGILVMNIQSFSMPEAAYINPLVYGDLQGINKWTWIFSHLFADQKFMTIFSLLFGAGIILITDKAVTKTGKSAGLHYKRTFWLLVIGLLHAHFIWYGDILVAYALCASFVYIFRKMKPKTLSIIGVLLLSVHTFIYGFFGMGLEYMPPEVIQDISSSWKPSSEMIQAEIAARTGNLYQQLNANSSAALEMETFVFFINFLWRAGGLMLIGMAFYKWGILSADRSRSFYLKGFLISSVIGFPIVILGIIKNFEANWSFEYSMFLGSQFNYWGSLFVSFAYICLIMLFCKSTSFTNFKARFAAIGQMALTNYITQSIICAFIFFGIGLGLFGEVERTVQIIIVMGIWLLQFAWSKPYLSHYKFGPLEWVWRSLTYWDKQPMKK